jgi:hypothetical protein
MRFIVRELPSREVVGQPFSAVCGINGPKARGDGSCFRGFLQSEGVGSTHKWFDRSSKVSPKLDLPGDRPFGDFPGQACIQDQFIG